MAFGTKLFTILARVVGGVWILSGIGFLLSALVQSENRILYCVVGTLLIVAGIGLMVVRPATDAAVSRFNEVAEKFIRKR